MLGRAIATGAGTASRRRVGDRREAAPRGRHLHQRRLGLRDRSLGRPARDARTIPPRGHVQHDRAANDRRPKLLVKRLLDRRFIWVSNYVTHSEPPLPHTCLHTCLQGYLVFPVQNLGCLVRARYVFPLGLLCSSSVHGRRVLAPFSHP